MQYIADFCNIISLFGKYDDLDADFDGIKKINVLDWLLEKMINKKSKIIM